MDYKNYFGNLSYVIRTVASSYWLYVIIVSVFPQKLSESKSGIEGNSNSGDNSANGSHSETNGNKNIAVYEVSPIRITADRRQCECPFNSACTNDYSLRAKFTLRMFL